MFLNSNDLEGAREVLNQPVTEEELAMMSRFGLEDGDGKIDMGEYMILSMVRNGVSPLMIELVIKRFQELDADGGGTLDLDEITEKVRKPSKAEGAAPERQAIDLPSVPTTSTKKSKEGPSASSSSPPTNTKEENDIALSVATPRRGPPGTESLSPAQGRRPSVMTAKDSTAGPPKPQKTMSRRSSVVAVAPE